MDENVHEILTANQIKLIESIIVLLFIDGAGWGLGTGTVIEQQVTTKGNLQMSQTNTCDGYGINHLGETWLGVIFKFQLLCTFILWLAGQQRSKGND